MLGIALLWCLSLLVVNSFGDFPLNDDWSFGLTVKHLVENGDFRPNGWFPMPFITNALWGSLFCIPFGFSFTALRISTITLSLIRISDYKMHYLTCSIQPGLGKIKVTA